jgi:hypothetical protein
VPTQKQLDLPLLRVVRLVASGTPVAAPDGLVYSTRPESWLDEGDAWWIVKGPEPEVVAAEAVGYLLAMETGIAVPSFALARRPGDESLLFASRKEHYRDVLPWLRRRREATLHSIAQICALDVMVGNRDRNLNNLLPPRTGGDDVIAIDFEKAVCVRSRHPLVESAEINPARTSRASWPCPTRQSVASWAQ